MNVFLRSENRLLKHSVYEVINKPELLRCEQYKIQQEEERELGYYRQSYVIYQ